MADQIVTNCIKTESLNSSNKIQETVLLKAKGNFSILPIIVSMNRFRLYLLRVLIKFSFGL